MDYAPLAAEDPASKSKASDEKRRLYEQAMAEQEELARLVGETSLIPSGSLSGAAYAFVFSFWAVLLLVLSYAIYVLIYVWTSELKLATGSAELCPQIDALYPVKHQGIFQDLVTSHYDSEAFKDYIIDTVRSESPA